MKTVFARLSQQNGSPSKPCLPERRKAAGDVDSVTDLHNEDGVFVQRNAPETHSAGSPGSKSGAETSARDTANTRTDWRDTLEAMCEA